MKRKVWHRYAVCYFTIAVVSLLLINLAGYSFCEKQTVKKHGEALYRECVTISEGYSEEALGNGLSMEQFMTQLRSVKEMLSAEIWVVDGDGTVLATTEKDAAVTGQNLKTLDPHLLGSNWSSKVTIPELHDDERMYAVSPVLSGVTIRGYIVIFEPMEQVLTEVRSTIRLADLMALVFLMIFGVAFAAFSGYHSLMLKRLNKAASAYTDGDFTPEPVQETVDEYRELGNSMRLLAEQHSNLVEYQKTFIANISHDFRSPLTSIKGYAEAMKDGTIPYEIQGKYLNIILFETDRLSNLTNDLLDLSNFENKGVRLIYSDFNITKMLRQSAMTFEGKCSQKNLKIRLLFPENDITVYADKGKIQQVIHNLVDNAIKFSHPDGVITVSIVEKREKVLVSVKDTGIGIPKESINKVWERFYKTDLSRGKDKRGTGLGLSITKQIIAAHNENIKVTSTEGVGTEFVFSLARSQR